MEIQTEPTKMQKNNSKGWEAKRLWTMQQQTRAIHIVRAEPQKSQMIKRNHRFIKCKGNHTMIFGELARRPLVATPSIHNIVFYFPRLS